MGWVSKGEVADGVLFLSLFFLFCVISSSASSASSSSSSSFLGGGGGVWMDGWTDERMNKRVGEEGRRAGVG